MVVRTSIELIRRIVVGDGELPSILQDLALVHAVIFTHLLSQTIEERKVAGPPPRGRALHNNATLLNRLHPFR